jgi:hypothetical protein
MTAAELLQQTRRLGFRLEPRPGGGLAVQPASKLSTALMAELRQHKTEIISMLTLPANDRAACQQRQFPQTLSDVAPGHGWQSVPPPDLPFVHLKPTPAAEQWRLTIAYLSRQCGGSPELREWLTRRKAHYAATFGQAWPAGLPAYAAARDAACWQLDRSEAKVLNLLEGINSESSLLL